MHMADALITPAVAGGMYACSGAAMCYSVKKIKGLEEPEKIPVMGVMGAFVFAAQMINFTIPGTGSSGHLCGGVLMSAVLGPEAGFLTMIGVLLVQCLLFPDGGLLALGAHIWHLAFYGCFIGGLLIWKCTMKRGMSRKKVIAASFVGCILTLQLGAFSVVLETMISGVTQLPPGIFLAAMQPIHLAIGLVEGGITAAVLLFLYEMRPELLWGYNGRTAMEKAGGSGEREQTAYRKKAARLSAWQTVGVLAVSALVIGGLLSQAASAYPDGLEWSIERTTGGEEISASGDIYEAAADVQEAAALFPDYGFRESGSAVGTSFSGVIGGITVIGLCVICCYALRFFRKRR